jgi:hypothetical protein
MEFEEKLDEVKKRVEKKLMGIARQLDVEVMDFRWELQTADDISYDMIRFTCNISGKQHTFKVRELIELENREEERWMALENKLRAEIRFHRE